MPDDARPGTGGNGKSHHVYFDAIISTNTEPTQTHSGNGKGRRSSYGLTLEQYAEHCGLPTDYLRRLGLVETYADHREIPCVAIPLGGPAAEPHLGHWLYRHSLFTNESANPYSKGDSPSLKVDTVRFTALGDCLLVTMCL